MRFFRKKKFFFVVTVIKRHNRLWCSLMLLIFILKYHLNLQILIIFGMCNFFKYWSNCELNGWITGYFTFSFFLEFNLRRKCVIAKHADLDVVFLSSKFKLVSTIKFLPNIKFAIISQEAEESQYFLTVSIRKMNKNF